MSSVDARSRSGLREAHAYLERARSRCPEPGAARFLGLILEKLERRLNQAEQAAPEPRAPGVEP